MSTSSSLKFNGMKSGLYKRFIFLAKPSRIGEVKFKILDLCKIASACIAVCSADASAALMDPSFC